LRESILANKTVDFAVRIVRFYQYLCKEKKEYVLSKQILKSGTSIGANVRESRNAQSKADFINKLNVALKEADETQYWLEIMERAEIIDSKQIESLHNDLYEIISILVSSIKTVKKKLKAESGE
jgi:four helix bundle protein